MPCYPQNRPHSERNGHLLANLISLAKLFREWNSEGQAARQRRIDPLWIDSKDRGASTYANSPGELEVGTV